MKNIDKKKIAVLIAFIVAVILLAFWLFRSGEDEAEINDTASFTQAADKEALSEHAAEEEAEENADLMFYSYFTENEQGDVVEEYITLDPSENKFMLEIVTNYDPESVVGTTGSYIIKNDQIIVSIDGKEYTGSYENEKIHINNKDYYLDDDSYV